MARETTPVPQALRNERKGKTRFMCTCRPKKPQVPKTTRVCSAFLRRHEHYYNLRMRSLPDTGTGIILTRTAVQASQNKNAWGSA